MSLDLATLTRSRTKRDLCLASTDVFAISCSPTLSHASRLFTGRHRSIKSSSNVRVIHALYIWSLRQWHPRATKRQPGQTRAPQISEAEIKRKLPLIRYRRTYEWKEMTPTISRTDMIAVSNQNRLDIIARAARHKVEDARPIVRLKRLQGVGAP